jgi:hypothetical protein
VPNRALDQDVRQDCLDERARLVFTEEDDAIDDAQGRQHRRAVRF